MAFIPSVCTDSLSNSSSSTSPSLNSLFPRDLASPPQGVPHYDLAKRTLEQGVDAQNEAKGESFFTHQVSLPILLVAMLEFKSEQATVQEVVDALLSPHTSQHFSLRSAPLRLELVVGDFSLMKLLFHCIQEDSTGFLLQGVAHALQEENQSNRKVVFSIALSEAKLMLIFRTISNKDLPQGSRDLLLAVFAEGLRQPNVQGGTAISTFYNKEGERRFCFENFLRDLSEDQQILFASSFAKQPLPIGVNGGGGYGPSYDSIILQLEIEGFLISLERLVNLFSPQALRVFVETLQKALAMEHKEEFVNKANSIIGPKLKLTVKEETKVFFTAFPQDIVDIIMEYIPTLTLD